MRYLRSNTAVIVTVGPFYDRTDGVTIETALTITNERITLTADTDAGSAPTNILDNVTGATSGTANDLNYITGNDAGMMQLELAAADTNRVGRMFLSITDAANHVPVFHEFFVLPQAIYDWFTGVIVPLPANITQLLGTAWLTPGTAGTPDVNAKLVGGQTASASGTVTFPNATLASTTNITAGTITTATTATNVTTVSSGAISEASFATTSGSFAPLGIIYQGTAQSVTSTTLVGEAALTNDVIKAGQQLFALGSTQGYWQSVMIDSVSGDTFTIAAWPVTTPSGTITYKVHGSAAASPTSYAALIDAVWDEATSGHSTAGTTGKALTDASSAGDPWSTAIPGAYSAGTAGSRLGKLPDVTAGGAGGVFIAGSNAATSITTALTANVTGNVTGNLSGSVGSVTGAVGSVTGAVGSVTGNVGGNVTGTVAGVTPASATSINATRYQKNTGSQKVFFTLVDSTDHVTRKTGITVTATRSLDGAAFGSATGTVTEIASGVYYLTPSAGDINADDVIYRFTGTACDPVELHVVTY